MHVDVSTEVVIRRPIEEVAAYAADPSNAPEWYENITAIEWQTEPRPAVGSRISFVARFLGRRLAYVYEITDYVPEDHLVMRTTQGPFPMETTYTWTARDAGTTQMTLRNRGTPTGFSALVAPFMQAAMRRANRKDLNSIQSILEANGHRLPDPRRSTPGLHDGPLESELRHPRIRRRHERRIPTRPPRRACRRRHHVWFYMTPGDR
jgi:uncharacterized protein YndB with AHSA1/START domain